MTVTILAMIRLFRQGQQLLMDTLTVKKARERISGSPSDMELITMKRLNGRMALFMVDMADGRFASGNILANEWQRLVTVMNIVLENHFLFTFFLR